MVSGTRLLPGTTRVMNCMISDDALREVVLNHLEWDNRINSEDVEVLVNDNVVTLNGSVPSYHDLVLVEADIRHIQGVQDLDNQLVVKFPEHVSVPEDEALRQKVQDRINADSRLVWDELKIRVEDGIVFIAGVVDALWKVEEAEEEVSEILGVRGIENNMVVAPAAQVGDDILTQRIRDTLTQDPTIDTKKLVISSQEGEVNIAGSVNTWAEHQAIHRLVMRVQGIKNFTDDLIIKWHIRSPIFKYGIAAIIVVIIATVAFLIGQASTWMAWPPFWTWDPNPNP